MKAIHYSSNHQDETMDLGSRLAKCLKPGDIICLFGDLGSGKTTLVKGLAKGLRINQKKVHSPTFVLLNIYEGKLPLFHFDLYRLTDVNDIVRLDYEEYFFDDGVSVVEWAEHLKTLTPEDFLKVQISHKSEGQRLIKISAQGKRSSQLMKALKL